jgi:hypothetical protein
VSIKDLVIGSIVTVTIGGTAYTVSQADVVKNFASDTGMSQQQAEEYVGGLKEEDFVTYDKLGAEYVTDGNSFLQTSGQIDCVNYEYEWEAADLTCEAGKAQLKDTGDDEIALGHAYTKLASSSASKADISLTIRMIDELNADYKYSIMTKLVDSAAISEVQKANSYNKAVLKAALDKE